jgi:multiple sugar transport system permease protein
MASAARRQAAPWRANDHRWGLLFIAPQAFGTILFVLLPLVVAMGLAFTSWDGLGPITWVGLENFVDQLTDPLFQRAIMNTIAIAVITIPIGLTLALLIAMGINQVRFRAFYLVLIVAPVVTSSVAVAMIWQQLLRADGLLSTALGMIPGVENPEWLTNPDLALFAVCAVIIWSSLGLNVLIFMAGLQAVPQQVMEAAKVDGAGRFTSFTRVLLPLLSPTIFFSTVVAVISSLQTFDTVFILNRNGGPDDATRTIVLHIYDLGFRRFELGVASAASVVLLVLTLGVTLVQFGAQKRLVHYES